MTIHKTYLSLIVLLGASLALSHSPIATSAALGIAAIKAGLVLLYFMKLRHSSFSLKVMALGAILWIGFLLALTSADYLTRPLQ